MKRRVNTKQRVNMHVGKGHPHQSNQPRPPRSEKECLDRIAQLEYRRMMLPKISNPRVLLRWEAYTQQIKILYTLLESFREEKKNAKKNKK